MTADPAVWMIRFRCGHRQRRSLTSVAPIERVEKAALIARGLCPACRRLADNGRRDRGASS
jgi:hypothetical protein